MLLLSSDPLQKIKATESESKLQMRFQTFVKVDASEESFIVWFGLSIEFRVGQDKIEHGLQLNEHKVKLSSVLN